MKSSRKIARGKRGKTTKEPTNPKTEIFNFLLPRVKYTNCVFKYSLTANDPAVGKVDKLANPAKIKLCDEITNTEDPDLDILSLTTQTNLNQTKHEYAPIHMNTHTLTNLDTTKHAHAPLSCENTDANNVLGERERKEFQRCLTGVWDEWNQRRADTHTRRSNTPEHTHTRTAQNDHDGCDL